MQEEFIFDEQVRNIQNNGIENQEKYIQQFFQQGVLSYENSENNSNSEKNIQTSKEIEDTQGLSQKISPRKKSKFHNYQKHLIITLRNICKQLFWDCNNYSKVVKQLCKTFCNTKSYNKSLLRMLFGQKIYGKQWFDKILFKKQGFGNIIEKYDHQQIVDAQIQLRLLVLQYLQKNSIDKLLKYRKLSEQTKILLKKYVQEFIEELKLCNLMKRLPKQRKNELLKMKF